MRSPAEQMKYLEEKKKPSPIELELDRPPEPAERCSTCQHLAVVGRRCQICGTTAGSHHA